MNKPDSTSKEICAALRSAGAFVQQIQSATQQAGTPDILVSHAGRWYVAELKAKKGKLSPAQAKWHLEARATVYVLRSPEDAIAMLSQRL